MKAKNIERAWLEAYRILGQMIAIDNDCTEKFGRAFYRGLENPNEFVVVYNDRLEVNTEDEVINIWVKNI